MARFSFSIILFCSVAFLTIQSEAQESETAFPASQRIANMAVLPLFLIPVIHESGHALVALAHGADSVSMKLFFPPNTAYSLDPNVSSYGFKRGTIFAGGFLATRLSCEPINYLLDRSNTPRWLEGFGGGLYSIMRFDLPIQYLWGLTYAVFGPSKGVPDFTGMTKAFSLDSTEEVLFYVATGLLIVADLYFSWSSIQRNFDRGVGR